ADALTAVCDTLGDTLRTVTFAHGRLVFTFGHWQICCDHDLCAWVARPLGSKVRRVTSHCNRDDIRRLLSAEQQAALDRLAIEVEQWCGEQLAQAVEDTDWTGNGTEASCG